MPDASAIRTNTAIDLAKMADELDRIPYAAETATKAWDEAMAMVKSSVCITCVDDESDCGLP